MGHCCIVIVIELTGVRDLLLWLVSVVGMPFNLMFSSSGLNAFVKKHLKCIYLA